MIPTLALAFLAVRQRPSLTIHLSQESGAYTVEDRGNRWHFGGRIEGTISSVRTVKGVDRIGKYEELLATWDEGGPVRGSIRWYDSTKAGVVVRFGLRYLSARKGNGVVFPSFTTFPARLTWTSFRDQAFSAPSNGLAQTSTPWLGYDGENHALIFSPASAFLVAKMSGDGATSIGEGLNLRLREVPAGLDQESLLVLGDGIGKTFDAWGSALRNLYKRPPMNDEADVSLTHLGYWTDNGADYYYNYDPARGYAPTLLAVAERYRKEGIPLGYLQLDSWWYPKSLNDPRGRPGSVKNPRLPHETWNRYGGLLEYVAHPALFPNGLNGFDQKLGLPLIVHSRWIDHESPYHSRYRISGVGAVDPRWWSDIAGYLRAGGVKVYEQDWLSEIYANSPEMAEEVGVGDAFADGMAAAASRDGLSMQYCMATPRFFLQGVKYPNLTTIRTSGDRFEPGKWANFLFVSQLAVEMGIAPFSDVFKSSETGNLTLAVLSCGPVGTGDAIGKEDTVNLRRAIRADGVIVKPDRAAVPTDDSWNRIGTPGTMIATTFTDQPVGRTVYAFAFPHGKGAVISGLAGVDVGLSRRSYVLDLTTGLGAFAEPADGTPPGANRIGYKYVMFAPVTKCGIVVLGDLDQIVPTGKKRISRIENDGLGVKVTVEFAAGEKAVTVSGVSPLRPEVRALSGRATLGDYSSSDGRFRVVVNPPVDGNRAIVWLAPPARVPVGTRSR